MHVILGTVLLVTTIVMFYRMEKHMSANQEKLNSLANSLNSAAARTRKAFDEITGEIQTLKDAVAAGETLDFSALDEAAANLGSSAEDLDNIVPDAEEAAADDAASTGDEPVAEEVTDPVEDGQRPSE